MPVRFVMFDVGETIIDETRLWAMWADWLKVPRHALLALLGAVIARGGQHRELFELLRPGFDIAEARVRRRAAGMPDEMAMTDLYPDVIPTLTELHQSGLRLGIAGNQPAHAESVLAALGLPLDVLAASERWGIEKPDPRFFARIVAEAGVPAREIAYVGDRLDNDVVPALNAGMYGVFLRRGPWGIIHAQRPDASRASLAIDTLAELPDAIRRINTIG
jgi:HAD superfamily hydrolase (TIGR01662 family)